MNRFRNWAILMNGHKNDIISKKADHSPLLAFERKYFSMFGAATFDIHFPKSKC